MKQIVVVYLAALGLFVAGCTHSGSTSAQSPQTASPSPDSPSGSGGDSTMDFHVQSAEFDDQVMELSRKYGCQQNFVVGSIVCQSVSYPGLETEIQDLTRALGKGSALMSAPVEDDIVIEEMKKSIGRTVSDLKSMIASKQVEQVAIEAALPKLNASLNAQDAAAQKLVEQLKAAGCNLTTSFNFDCTLNVSGVVDMGTREKQIELLERLQTLTSETTEMYKSMPSPGVEENPKYATQAKNTFETERNIRYECEADRSKLLSVARKDLETAISHATSLVVDDDRYFEPLTNKSCDYANLVDLTTNLKQIADFKKSFLDAASGLEGKFADSIQITGTDQTLKRYDSVTAHNFGPDSPNAFVVRVPISASSKNMRQLFVSLDAASSEVVAMRAVDLQKISELAKAFPIVSNGPAVHLKLYLNSSALDQALRVEMLSAIIDSLDSTPRKMVEDSEKLSLAFLKYILGTTQPVEINVLVGGIYQGCPTWQGDGKPINVGYQIGWQPLGIESCVPFEVLQKN